MSEIIGLLKKGVTSQKKIYAKYCENYRGTELLTYKNFKRDSVELLELKKYVKTMQEDNYLTKTEINNIFKYLTNNLKYSKYSNVKKIVKILKEFKTEIKAKQDNLHDNEKNTYNSLVHISYHINLLRELVAKKISLNYRELDSVIKFENLMKEIINKNDICEANKSIGLIMDNLEILSYHDHKGRTFNDLIHDAILYAKLNDNKNLLEYYSEILKFIINIKCLKIDKDGLLDLFEIEADKIEYGSALNNKIFDLKFDSRTGRYLLTDEFIISVDNEDTKKIDDALSIETTPYGSYILGIHVTDVPSLGMYANEILNNGSGICASKMKASLEEFQKKNAITIFVEISKQGFILNYRALQTRIEVDRNLLYDDFAKILSEGDVKPGLSETVMNLTDLYNIVENEKLPKYPNINNIAKLLVKKYMLLYGCITSDIFNINKIPGIYLDGESNLYTLDKSKYDAGFTSFDSYSKSTSPLYDRSSLINQFLMQECVFKQMSSINKERLQYVLVPVVDDINKKKNS